MSRARMASARPPTRVSPNARPRRPLLDRDLELPSTRAVEPPSTRVARKSEPTPVSASTSKRDSNAINPFYHRIYVRVGIVCGAAALVFLFFAAAATWLLPALTSGARDDAPIAKSAREPVRSSAAAETSSPEQPDAGRIATAPSAWTSLPEQKPSVAVVIPQGAPPSEQVPESAPPAEIAPPLVTSPDSATATQQLDLNQTEDAKRVQQRLIELGFLFGTADGAWGARSRKALQDFRMANGLGDGDTWDEATQERLLTASDVTAATPSDISFVGGWGVDAAQCREEPLTITATRAEASGAACDFRSTQRESSNVWRLRAQCAGNGERWTANIRFTLSGRKLIWSSERGTTSYMRCPI
jgi:Putative peptidoglycan binding domain